MRFLLAGFLLAVPIAAHAQTQTIDFSDPKSVSTATTYVLPDGGLSGAEVSLKNGALLVTNRTPGSFGVQWNLTGADGKTLDGDNVEHLAFDFKAAPDVKINWFFEIGTKFYGVTVSGADSVRPGSILLGRANMTPLADGWRRVDIPLREWLRAADPLATSFPIDEIISGNWENDTFLLAGIGGNPPGSSYQVDNLTIAAPDPKSAPPHLGTPVVDGDDIVWPFTAPAGIRTQDVKLRAAGKDYLLTSPLLRYQMQPDAAAGGFSQELRLSAAEAGITAPDGGSIHLQLLGFKDALGRVPDSAPSADQGVEAQVGVVYAAHHTPVLLPRVLFPSAIAGIDQAPNDDFETGLDGWKGISSVTEQVPLANEPSVPANGQGAIRLHNPRTAGAFGTIIQPTAFDATQFPTLTFDYRADDRARLDFQFNWGAGSPPYYVRFLDRDNDPNLVGTISGIQTDNQWHSATVPLLDMMKKSQPSATSFQVSNLSLLDHGWHGNANGVEVWIDNFRFAPSVGVGGPLKVAVALRDITGLKATSWLFDQKPLSVPDTTAQGDAHVEVPLKGDAPGLWWLHLRAQDGAGNWSQTAHFPVVITP